MAEHKRIKLEPLDERIHMRPEVIEWWQLGQNEFPNPHFPNDDRIMHHYFRELPDPSPFDHTSNNGVIFKQAESNYEPWRTVHDRQAFEAALRKLKGSEYVIVGEPQQIPNGPPGTKNGMWVFRKQDRTGDKAADGEYKEVETLGTYYFLGLQGFQAPSLLDVVENRLLNTTTSLNKVLDMAKKLPSFSPTTGYTYEVDTKKATPASGSTAGSPTRSREGSVAPGLESQSLCSASAAPGGGGQASSASQADDGGLLWSSLNMAISYADDYIDENPLEGEPGRFKFATSKSAIQRRREEEEAAAKKAREQKEAASRVASAKPSPLPTKAPSPPAIFTEAKTGKSEKKRKEEKKQRRKSRPNATTPATPASATGNGPPPSAG